MGQGGEGVAVARAEMANFIRNLAKLVPTAAPAAGALAGVGAVGWAGYNSLFNVEGGHRAIVFNRVFGVKDKVRMGLEMLSRTLARTRALPCTLSLSLSCRSVCLSVCAAAPSVRARVRVRRADGSVAHALLATARRRPAPPRAVQRAHARARLLAC